MKNTVLTHEPQKELYPPADPKRLIVTPKHVSRKYQYEYCCLFSESSTYLMIKIPGLKEAEALGYGLK
jgi:hypothetical protein